MKCYEEARSGADKDAVAVCAICGKGLCAEHAHEARAPARAPAAVVGRVHPAWHSGAPMLVLCSYCLEETEGQ